MKLKRVIAIACTAAMTASLISGCGGSSDEGQKEAVKEAEGTAKEDLSLAKISGDSYSTSGRENESECEDPGRNVV